MPKPKTPRERAQEDLDTASRVLERANARVERVEKENPPLIEKYKEQAEKKQAEIERAREERAAARRRVEFLGTHPDLNDEGDDGVTEPDDDGVTESDDVL